MQAQTGDTPKPSSLEYGQVAQSVEQGTENPRVGSSILSLATTLLIYQSVIRLYPMYGFRAVLAHSVFAATLSTTLLRGAYGKRGYRCKQGQNDP